ncbi:hypothetical protein [Malikia spinosa]|uniref:hypothetical protein n=1 Tax=Malikia spinosa TaxID=86180 RepID=UPI002FDA2CDC
MSLIDRLRKAREIRIEAGGQVFTALRPTDMDMVGLIGADGYALLKFVIGWEMTELDLGIPGGSGEAVPFQPDLFAEWIKDQPALWTPLIIAIKDAYAAHSERLEQAAKN